MHIECIKAISKETMKLRRVFDYAIVNIRLVNGMFTMNMRSPIPALMSRCLFLVKRPVVQLMHRLCVWLVDFILHLKSVGFRHEMKQSIRMFNIYIYISDGDKYCS